jgi:hypothetical protein
MWVNVAQRDLLCGLLFLMYLVSRTENLQNEAMALQYYVECQGIEKVVTILFFLHVFSFFSYNRITYIKNAQRSFEIAEPAVIVTLFMVMFFCISDTGPSPAGKRFMVLDEGGNSCSGGSAGGHSCEGIGEVTGDNGPEVMMATVATLRAVAVSRAMAA